MGHLPKIVGPGKGFDLANVARGQYEVWVGTYGRTATLQGQLHQLKTQLLSA